MSLLEHMYNYFTNGEINIKNTKTMTNIRVNNDTHCINYVYLKNNKKYTPKKPRYSKQKIKEIVE
jgi:hypothetical protein